MKLIFDKENLDLSDNSQGITINNNINKEVDNETVINHPVNFDELLNNFSYYEPCFKCGKKMPCTGPFPKISAGWSVRGDLKFVACPEHTDLMPARLSANAFKITDELEETNPKLYKKHFHYLEAANKHGINNEVISYFYPTVKAFYFEDSDNAIFIDLDESFLNYNHETFEDFIQDFNDGKRS